MTCIAALVHKGKVYMAGDSAGIAGWSLSVRADPKVFRNGPFVMGFTTSFRMGQLLRYSFVPPAHDPSVDLDRFMATAFVDAVRACLKAGGYATREKEAESGGTFLVGYRGELFAVQEDYQVGRMADGFAAVGCGADLALGSLHSTRKEKPDYRLRVAMEASERFNAGVRGPFAYVNE